MNDIIYKKSEPDYTLSDFVKCFWTVQNISSREKTYTILPDGYFDILLKIIRNSEIKIFLIGLSTREYEYVVPENTNFYAVSFKLPAAEYIFKTCISNLIDKQEETTDIFKNVKISNVPDFRTFLSLFTKILISMKREDTDPRKMKLFKILYEYQGNIGIEEISGRVYWSSRQINRYFRNRFGLSLKSYCSILRYRASFDQIKNRQFYPLQNYSDQSHFIREVKKYSGVTPLRLAENKNDRFIQFSTL